MLTEKARELRQEYFLEWTWWTRKQRAGFIRRVKNLAAKKIQNPPVGTDQTHAQMILDVIALHMDFHIDTWKESK